MDAIPLVHASLGERELAAVAEVFASGWPAGQGPQGKALEARLAAEYMVGDAVAVSNCGAALHLAMLALGWGPATRSSSPTTVSRRPPRPPATSGPPRLRRRTPRHLHRRPAGGGRPGHPRTAGIIAVDTVGLPADYTELQEIADRHGLFLVEDAACAVGATYQGAKAGALAEVGCLSFHGRKGASSGEGGALLASDPEIGKDARLRSSFGIGSIFDMGNVVGLPIPVFTEIGYNFKLSDIAAAILQVQLGRIGELLARRSAVAAQYGELLAGEDLLTLPHVPADRTHAWQTYMVTLDERVERGAVATALRAQGIGCGHGTFAGHTQPVFDAKQTCPVSLDLATRQLAIPMHAELTQDQVTRVAHTLREAVHAHAGTARRAA
ncbi:DegT/DnrJ/EryC1/StrS aminotransferase family protein (plasmid) [Streptomyces sp. AD2-2]|nr:DegT/DnrJ/EryC1/StrS aminotransferase family protein [Streptomyces sp. AD2-2]